MNGENPEGEATRYAIEIHDNKSHDNTLGYSGTAGNSIWAHDNRFYGNATGIATDSLFPGHPGLPQDHARWSNNEIYSNNRNWYTEIVDKGICSKPMKERGYIDGAVCPVVPDPGRHRRADRRRQLQLDRPQLDLRQLALRHDAVLGARSAARRVRPGQARRHLAPQPHDRQPHGHRARRRRSRTTAWTTGGTTRATATAGRTTPTRAATRPTTSPSTRPLRRGRLVFTPGLAVKDAGFLSCSQYDRNDETWRHPPACNWFDSPSKPTGADPSPVQLRARPVGFSAPSLGFVIGPMFGLATLAGSVVAGGDEAVARGRRSAAPAGGRGRTAAVLVAGVGTPPYDDPAGADGDRTHVGHRHRGERRVHDRRRRPAGALPRPRDPRLPLPALQRRPLPVTVTASTPAARLPAVSGTSRSRTPAATGFGVPAHGEREVHLLLRMGGCESLSARAGSFAEAVLRADRAARDLRRDRCRWSCPRRSTPVRPARRSAPTPPPGRGLRADLTAVSDSR